MSVVNALNATLYSTLTGGTALTSLLAGTTSAYYQQAPDGAALPYVVFSHQSGVKENITTSDMRNQIVFVRGYANTPALAGSIDAQCHALLDGKTLNVSGWTNFWTVRESDFNAIENPPDGEKVYASGGLYRIRLT